MDEDDFFLETTQVPNLDESSTVNIITLNEDILQSITLDEDLEDTDDTNDIPFVLLYDKEEYSTNYEMLPNIIEFIDLDETSQNIIEVIDLD